MIIESPRGSGAEIEKLLTLKAPDLNDVCAALGLTVEERDKDLPRKLRRLILQYIEGEDIISLEDEGMSVLLELNDKIDISNNTEGQKESGSNQNVAAAVASQNVSFVHPL